jgi:GTP-binding protein
MVCALLDARHKPTGQDGHMLEILDDAQVPTLLVATKMDKLKPAERPRQLRLIRETLELDKDALLVPFSGVTGEGIRELWRVFDDMIQQPGPTREP